MAVKPRAMGRIPAAQLKEQRATSELSSRRERVNRLGLLQHDKSQATTLTQRMLDAELPLVVLCRDEVNPLTAPQSDALQEVLLSLSEPGSKKLRAAILLGEANLGDGRASLVINPDVTTSLLPMRHERAKRGVPTLFCLH